MIERLGRDSAPLMFGGYQVLGPRLWLAENAAPFPRMIDKNGEPIWKTP